MNFSNLITVSVALMLFVACGGGEQSGDQQTDTSNETMKSEQTESAEPNTLTAAEKQEGWKLLFDGKSTEHWRGYNDEQFPKQGWVAENGMLTVQGSDGSVEGRGGDIITKKEYENFILKLEWRVSKGGNSGIFYAGIEQEGIPIYWSAPEMQILDNANHPDAERGQNGNRQAGSLYDLIPADPQNFTGHGEWQQVKIVVDGALVEHWQNGEKVLEYERWTPEWYEMIRDSKFKDHPEFGDAKKGHIGLQDHGFKVDFRNIKIKEL